MALYLIIQNNTSQHSMTEDYGVWTPEDTETSGLYEEIVS
jgi:hypothetical protein